MRAKREADASDAGASGQRGSLREEQSGTEICGLTQKGFSWDVARCEDGHDEYARHQKGMEGDENWDKNVRGGGSLRGCTESWKRRVADLRWIEMHTCQGCSIAF